MGSELTPEGEQNSAGVRGEATAGRPRQRERHGVWEGSEVKESLALGGMGRR